MGTLFVGTPGGIVAGVPKLKVESGAVITSRLVSKVVVVQGTPEASVIAASPNCQVGTRNLTVTIARG